MVTRRLLIGLTAALLFSSAITLALSRHLAHTHNGGPTVRLVAVARDVPAGQALDASALKLVDWPDSPAVRGSVTKVDTLVGRVPLIALTAGDLVLEQQVSPVGSVNLLTRKIPPGLRAIALKSDEVAGVAGFLLPGSAVDVLVTSTGFSSNASTSTVVQDVPVLAAGQKTEPDPDGKPVTTTVVTLLVTPVEAEKLALASSSGKIHFVLRNEADRKQIANLLPELSAPSQPPQTGTPVSGAATVNAAGKPHAEPTSLPGKTPANTKPQADTVEVITGGPKSNPPSLPALPGSRP